MTGAEAIVLAKAAWQNILKPFARWRIALARRREAAKTAGAILLLLACAGCASLDPFWIWIGDNTSIEKEAGNDRP